MKKVSELTRQEKIELIRKLQAGEVHVLDGKIIQLSHIIIYQGEHYDWEKADKFRVGDQEYSPEEFEKLLELYPEGTALFFFPEKDKHEEE